MENLPRAASCFWLAFVFILRVILDEGGKKETKRLVNAFIKLTLDRIYTVFVNMRVY